ncbi:MAG: hypothetical protein ACRDDJ_09850, partial [[Mycobacterium] stephanolepidis]
MAAVIVQQARLFLHTSDTIRIRKRQPESLDRMTIRCPASLDAKASNHSEQPSAAVALSMACDPQAAVTMLSIRAAHRYLVHPPSRATNQ